MHRWWDGIEAERYWVEITDRPDIGDDLNAPEFNERGQAQWSYDLVLEPAEGDVVYHFDKGAEAFVAYSHVVGEAWKDSVVWGAKGSSARGNDVTPYARPGWRRGLRGLTTFEPVTLEELRAVEADVLRIKDELTTLHGSPLYFPFTPYRGQPLRTFQGYFVKMPAALVTLCSLPIPGVASAGVIDDKPTASDRPGAGAAYRRADERVAVAQADPMARDPAVMERALKSHRATQNAVADWALSQGLAPLSPMPGDPDWDVAWRDGGTLHVVEVKSITPQNEERQLRLAVGQVLRYRQRLEVTEPGGVKAVIATSCEPADGSWHKLCESLEIELLWPARLAGTFLLDPDPSHR